MNDPMVAELLRCLAENSLMRREAMNGLVEKFREQEREIAELRKALGVVQKLDKLTVPMSVPAGKATAEKENHVN